jgi:hypothetical protein
MYDIMITGVMSGLIIWLLSWMMIRKTNTSKITLSSLSNDELHDILATLTNRMVILNWYDRSYMSEILGQKIDDTFWRSLVDNQDQLADATNQLVHEWASSVQEKLQPEEEEEEEEEENKKTLEEVLGSLSNSQLRKYAGVTSTGKTKAYLVEIIMNQFNQNMKKVVDAKLEKLALLLT